MSSNAQILLKSTKSKEIYQMIDVNSNEQVSNLDKNLQAI
jgi:hypothetical protein